jgi:asparagine synthase (glutamine-hydrolysing)
MCGILAISSEKAANNDMNKPLQAISHRGPDDNGVFCSDECDCMLAQARLSIIDLSAAGHQPMSDNTGRYVMVFNGEIYNFKELKEQLNRQHSNICWKSSSDSEVILEGFVRNGYQFLSLLNGIFSIVVYDKETREMYVLRDPVGIKPLYFTEQNETVYFSSEVKGILSFSDINVTLRRQSLADQLSFMYVPEPFTMYNEIYKIKPGLLYIYKKGKLIKKEELFEHLKDKLLFSSEDDMIVAFRETFSGSVKRQLVADVPISLFLSGGLDSSAISYETVRNGGNVKTAYTITFSKKDSQYDGQSNDLFYAEKVARQLGLSLQVISAEEKFLQLLPDLIPYMEDGISDPAAINTYLICKSAREDGVKVMLNGQGADEYLCGYRRYYAEQILQNMPGVLKIGLAIAYPFIPTSIPGKYNAAIRRAKRLALASSQQKRDRIAGYFMWSTPDNIRNLFKEKNFIAPGDQLYTFFDDHNSEDTLSLMLKADQHFDLLSLNLSYTDKMSMRVGVEARVPFLDLEMVKLMNSLPINMKMRGGEQKFILKKAMEPYLPTEVIYRQKAGFALPIRSWFKSPNDMTSYYFHQKRIREQGLFDEKVITEMLSNQFSGKTDYSYILFAMLCQQIWLDNIYHM